MANFKAFCWKYLSSTNSEIERSDSHEKLKKFEIYLRNSVLIHLTICMHNMESMISSIGKSLHANFCPQIFDFSARNDYYMNIWQIDQPYMYLKKILLVFLREIDLFTFSLFFFTILREIDLFTFSRAI